MAHLSKIAGELPEGYGYVLLTGVGNLFLNVWMAVNVGRARKQYEVMVSTFHTQVFNYCKHSIIGVTIGAKNTITIVLQY